MRNILEYSANLDASCSTSTENAASDSARKSVDVSAKAPQVVDASAAKVWCSRCNTLKSALWYFGNLVLAEWFLWSWGACWLCSRSAGGAGRLRLSDACAKGAESLDQCWANGGIAFSGTSSCNYLVGNAWPLVVLAKPSNIIWSKAKFENRLLQGIFSAWDVAKLLTPFRDWNNGCRRSSDS